MKTKSLYLYLVALACLLPFCGCSDDDDVVTTPLTAPTLTADEVGVHALYFSWPAVSGATQYAYELRKDSEDAILEGDVTNTTWVAFDNLNDETSYTLTVWAYGEYGGDKSTSQVSTITASTLPRIQLADPHVSVAVSGKSATASWDPVEHADKYQYECRDADGAVVEAGQTADAFLRFSLEAGTYTLWVVSESSDWDYCSSEGVTVSFTIENKLLYQAQGTFNYGGYSWEAVISAYENGYYSIASWYGAEGYDLNFSTSEDLEAVSLREFYEFDGYYYHVPMDSEYFAYVVNGESTISRNGRTVTLRFLEYYSGECTFTWDEPVSGGALTVDELVGEYTEVASGQYYGDGWVEYSYDDNVVTIEKVDDTTVSVKNFFYIGEALTATLDAEARTLTFATGQTFDTYYTFANDSAEDVPVVATISEEGVITIDGWAMWYGGYSYSYGTKCTLTPSR